MVDTALLKQLRDITKAPFKDCKEVLDEANGDMDKAQELLKEKWAHTAMKKAGRETNEWIVKVKKFDNVTVWVKLWCETDFVAKSDEFHSLADDVVDLFKSNWNLIDDIDDVDSSFMDEKVNPLLEEYIWKIWENIKLLDVFVDNKNCFVYTHPWDKVVAVVYYDWEDSSNVSKEIALQIAAMSPSYTSMDDIPSDEYQSLKDGYIEEMKDSWKPADIVDKIVEWKLSKYYQELVLLEQSYIRDDTKKIKDIIPENFKLLGYRRYSI